MAAAKNPHRKGNGRGIQFLRANVGHQGDDCLMWPFGRNNTGYGQVGFLGKVRKAHRLMCELLHGPAPDGHEASHSCGNGMGGCVNPNHLSWKTRSENQMDRRRHGTAVTNIRGAGGKLTDRDKEEIRALRGSMKQRQIALKFGVHFETISRILRTPAGRPRAFIPWQPDEDNILMDGRARGMRMRAIAETLGRTAVSADRRFRLLKKRLTLEGKK